MVKYVLHYFDARGRAETIRLIFAAKGTPFEDHRIESKDWPAFKPKTPAGQLPVLEVDGKMLPESIAVARFAARETGLVGKTSFDQARVDALADVVTELREKFFGAMIMKDEAAKGQALKDYQESSPKLLDFLVKASKMHKGDFLYGELTWVDLHLYAVIESIKGWNADFLKNHKELADIVGKVEKLPKVATYLKNRKVTQM